MSKITYREIFEKSSFIKNLPIAFEGRVLPKGMPAKVIMVRIQYDNLIEAFEKEMSGKVLEGLKKEGFSERCQKFQEMEDIDMRRAKAETWKEGDVDSEGEAIEKPSMPSEEELKKAEEIRKGKEDFDKECAELDEEYMQARKTRLSEEIDMKERKFTVDELSELIELIGLDEGTIKVNGRDVPKSIFINVIAAKFVE